jgi:hypothetical protein
MSPLVALAGLVALPLASLSIVVVLVFLILGAYRNGVCTLSTLLGFGYPWIGADNEQGSHQRREEADLKEQIINVFLSD